MIIILHIEKRPPINDITLMNISFFFICSPWLKISTMHRYSPQRMVGHHIYIIHLHAIDICDAKHYGNKESECICLSQTFTIWLLKGHLVLVFNICIILHRFQSIRYGAQVHIQSHLHQHLSESILYCAPAAAYALTTPNN